MIPPSGAVIRLNQLLAEVDAPVLSPELAEQFGTYLALLRRWNARTNLTAIRDEESILSRHFVESVLCSYELPRDVISLLDFGSGAGFPGLPIALLRKEISVTLAESQNKKAAFLREAVRVLGLKARVHSGRAEELQERFDCVTLRAVDNMERALRAALNLVIENGWLCVLTTTQESADILQALQLVDWQAPVPLAKNTSRILLLGKKRL